MNTDGGLNGSVASASRIVVPYTSNRPFLLEQFVSMRTCPPIGAFDHVVDTGEETEIVAVFDDEL